MRGFFIICLFIFNIANLKAATVDTFMVSSNSMNKTIPNVVILPNAYSQKVNYPVLYLLHGAGGSYSNWINRVESLKEKVDLYNMIIVCPDGGVTSWYFDSPVDAQMRYETYVSAELVSAIDQKYKTVANKKGRAITGLSMGGHGAFYLAFKHQDVYGAAGSMSGGVDIRPFPNNWDLAKRLGEYAKNQENWEKNSVINLVYLLNGKDLKLIFDCGVQDFFYEVNKQLHQKLLERNIPHDYIERPGGHTWDYWTNAITYQLLYFNTYFKAN